MLAHPLRPPTLHAMKVQSNELMRLTLLVAVGAIFVMLLVCMLRKAAPSLAANIHKEWAAELTENAKRVDVSRPGHGAMLKQFGSHVRDRASVLCV